jgi:TrpR-related protein YerC/YecD
MNDKLQNDSVDFLFDAILQLKTREECYSFFEDLCTVKELQSMSQRMEVAAMLTGNETYLTIASKTGASTATISRVNRSLAYGKDGYKLVLDRMKDEE